MVYFRKFYAYITPNTNFFQATYSIFGGSSGFNIFSEVLYKLLGIISFIGVILVTVFSCILIMNNIKFKDK